MGRKILDTQRLSIEECDSNDDWFFLELLNSPNWLKFIGDRSVKTKVDAAAYIKNRLAKSYQEHGFGLYKVMIKSELKPIGVSGFVKRDYLNFPDIGFAILPEYEGYGIVSEATTALMDFGEKELGLTQILGITTKENVGSQRVLNKIGLTLKKNIQPPNEKGEFLLFSNQE